MRGQFTVHYIKFYKQLVDKNLLKRRTVLLVAAINRNRKVISSANTH